LFSASDVGFSASLRWRLASGREAGHKGRSPPVRAGLAQLVERQFCKLDVAGSIPATGTISSRLGPAVLQVAP
jgi:hypothetical protein